MKYFSLTVVAIFILSFSTALYAQQGNYQNYPIGERAAGLGGAYTAIAADSTAAWYNPGGLAFLSEGEVSLSATAYNYFEGTSENQFGTSRNTTASNFSAIPAVVSYSRPLLSGFITFVLLEPKYLDFEQLDTDIPATAGEDYSYFKRFHHHELWAGFAYGFRIQSDLGIGFSILGVEVSHSQEEITSQPASGSPPTEIDFIHEGISMKTYFLTFGIGMFYIHDRNWKFGLHIRTQGLTLGSLFSGGGDGYRIINDIVDPSNNVYIVQKNLDTNYMIPWRIFLGASYQEPYDYTISFEIAFQTGKSYFKYLDSSDFNFGIEYNPVFNFNFGAEYFLSEEFIIRGGIYTDFAPEETPSANRPWNKVHIIGITAAIAWRSNRTSTSITLVYAGGFGDTINTEGKRTDYTINSLYLIIGGAYFFG